MGDADDSVDDCRGLLVEGIKSLVGDRNTDAGIPDGSDDELKGLIP